MTLTPFHIICFVDSCCCDACSYVMEGESEGDSNGVSTPIAGSDTPLLPVSRSLSLSEQQSPLGAKNTVNAALDKEAVTVTVTASVTQPKTVTVKEKDKDADEGRVIDVTISSDDLEDGVSTPATTTDSGTLTSSSPSSPATLPAPPATPITPHRTRTLSNSSLFPATPSSQPVDYHHRILILAKEGVRKLGNVYDKKLEGRDALQREMTSLGNEMGALKGTLSNLQGKRTKESERLSELRKEKELQTAERKLKTQQTLPTPPLSPLPSAPSPPPSKTASGASPGASSSSSSDPKAQMSYLNLQLQTLRKRKVTTQSLIATLEADSEQYR